MVYEFFYPSIGRAQVIEKRLAELDQKYKINEFQNSEIPYDQPSLF